ncbi:hypothetical protein [Iodobacter ciconiae]|uniref:Uncharacterized protein n=1 Tax=Iodobacter ciconiae TaxID=2496266 RepID=A0A3S8ZSZ3_9NEIS|nr:hypothetical protein [Iodobacter ciconiae]AZN36620.1 hypothetical protein EJO50_09005 [Iodobacter ciconiae]
MLAARNIKIPKNQTAAMQLLQLYMQSGHYYWISGVVARTKLHRLVAKLNAFRITRDAPGRAYDKAKGLASTHLVVFEQGDDELLWFLVGTAGKGGLIDPEQADIGTIYDSRLAGQHLRFKHYELLHAEKRIKQVRDTTWTWRIAPQRVKEHEAFIVQLIRQRDMDGLNTELTALAAMPQFSGVRGQVLKLFAETKKLGLKFKQGEVAVPTLPYMTRMSIYTEPAKTLSALCEVAL